MRLLVLLFLILITFVGYLAYLNPGNLTLYFTKEESIEIPITAVVLLSMAFGGLIVSMVAGFVETKHLFMTWRLARTKKREERIGELLHQGLNAKASRRYSEAAGLFQKVLELSPNHVPTLLRLGNLYRMQGNPLEAVRMHRKAKGSDEKNIELLLCLSKDLEEAHRMEEAIQTLEEILKIDRECFSAQIRLRELYARLERWEEAHAIQERILEGTLLPEEAKVQQTWMEGIKYELGRRLLKDGHPDRARRYFRGAIEPAEDRMPDLYKLLGNLYLRKGELSEACEEFKKALDLKKRVLVPYYCPSCDFHTTHWSGRCPRCGQWSTFEASPVMGERVQAKTTIK